MRLARVNEPGRMPLSLIAAILLTMGLWAQATHAAALPATARQPAIAAQVPVMVDAVHTAAIVQGPPSAAAAGLPNLPVTQSLVTCWGRMEHFLAQTGQEPIFGTNMYDPCIRTAEESVNVGWQAGSLSDGWLADWEVPKWAAYNADCHGRQFPWLDRLTIATLSGEVPCGTGRNGMTPRVHMEVPHEIDPSINQVIIQLVFNPDGQGGKALEVAHCESTFFNLAGRYYRGLFQIGEHFANPGNAIPNEGLNLEDVWDPGYNALVARHIARYFEYDWYPTWSCG